MLRYHQSGKPDLAKCHLLESLQSVEMDAQDRAVSVSATMTFPCTAVLDETTELYGLEMDKANVAVSATVASNSKWNLSVGAVSNSENGKTESNGTIAAEYKPSQGVQLNGSIDLSNPFRFSLGTTRAFSNKTVGTANVRTIPNTDTLSLSLVSHRALMDNQFRGTGAIGMGTDFGLHFGLLSVTTLWEDQPEYTAKLNLGMKRPFKLSAKHTFDRGGTGDVSCEFGQSGCQWRAVVSRALTTYATLSMGIKYAADMGLVWLFALERGDLTFRIPILVSSISDSAYLYQTVYLSMITLLLDQLVKDIVEDTALAATGIFSRDATTGDNADEDKNAQTHGEPSSSLLVLSKTSTDSDLQISLMAKASEARRLEEQASGGLVIHKASYSVVGGQSLDVRIPLQFWVRRGELVLVAAPKSDLMGFRNVRRSPGTTSAWWKALLDGSAFGLQFPWGSALIGQNPDDKDTPRLYIRYESAGEMYEITIRDNDGLRLPSPDAFHLGPSNRIM